MIIAVSAASSSGHRKRHDAPNVNVPRELQAEPHEEQRPDQYRLERASTKCQQVHSYYAGNHYRRRRRDLLHGHRRRVTGCRAEADRESWREPDRYYSRCCQLRRGEPGHRIRTTLKLSDITAITANVPNVTAVAPYSQLGAAQVIANGLNWSTTIGGTTTAWPECRELDDRARSIFHR